MAKQQIIAMGGGGFSMETTPLLDDYILAASEKETPRICFVGTASGDSESLRLQFYNRFSQANCRPTTLQLFRRQITDLVNFACSQDIIYVGGGNTVNMLAIWRAHGFDIALKEAYKRGTILAGLSAGSICWFEQGVTDSYGLELAQIDCLGFLEGSNCPHYDGEANRRPAYQSMVRNGMLPGYAADDGVALHFINGELHKTVSSRPHAQAFRVSRDKQAISETPLDTIFLGYQS